MIRLSYTRGGLLTATSSTVPNVAYTCVDPADNKFLFEVINMPNEIANRIDRLYKTMSGPVNISKRERVLLDYKIQFINRIKGHSVIKPAVDYNASTRRHVLTLHYYRPIDVRTLAIGPSMIYIPNCVKSDHKNPGRFLMCNHSNLYNYYHLWKTNYANQQDPDLF